MLTIELDAMITKAIDEGFKQYALTTRPVAFHLKPSTPKSDGVIAWSFMDEAAPEGFTIPLPLPNIAAMPKENIVYAIREKCFKLPMYKHVV